MRSTLLFLQSHSKTPRAQRMLWERRVPCPALIWFSQTVESSGHGDNRTYGQTPLLADVPNPEGARNQPPDSRQIQLRGKGVRLHIGGVLLGLSLSNILQGWLPLLGVQGRRPSSKSLCHQAAQRSETQMMFYEWLCLGGKLDVVMADRLGWINRAKLGCNLCK